MATSWAIVKKDINTPQAQLVFFLFFLVARLFFFGVARTIITFPFFFLGMVLSFLINPIKRLRGRSPRSYWASS
jgi:hypothetical protein